LLLFRSASSRSRINPNEGEAMIFNAKMLTNAAVIAAVSLTSLTAAAADCKDVALADGQVAIHYNRPDGNYEDWGIHIWKSPNIGLTNWFIPKMPTGCDSFGMYWTLPLGKFGETKIVNYIIHKGDVKEQGGTDMNFDANKTKEIWVNAGSPVNHMSKDDAVKAQSAK
jgi:hypothetical protein